MMKDEERRARPPGAKSRHRALEGLKSCLRVVFRAPKEPPINTSVPRQSLLLLLEYALSSLSGCSARRFRELRSSQTPRAHAKYMRVESKIDSV
jgi:hypothetical protein